MTRGILFICILAVGIAGAAAHDFLGVAKLAILAAFIACGACLVLVHVVSRVRL